MKFAIIIALFLTCLKTGQSAGTFDYKCNIPGFCEVSHVFPFVFSNFCRCSVLIFRELTSTIFPRRQQTNAYNCVKKLMIARGTLTTFQINCASIFGLATTSMKEALNSCQDKDSVSLKDQPTVSSLINFDH